MAEGAVAERDLQEGTPRINYIELSPDSDRQQTQTHRRSDTDR